MTSELSGRVLRRGRGQASVSDRLRERLVDEMGLWKAQLAYDTAVFDRVTASPDADPSGVERATAALHMYLAVEAIEEFEQALRRLEDGNYGTCQSCGRPIALARLEVIPQTRFCAACPTAADKRLELRRRRGRSADVHGCSSQDEWVTSSRAVVDTGLLAESAARHPSTLRPERVLEDPAPP